MSHKDPQHIAKKLERRAAAGFSQGKVDGDDPGVTTLSPSERSEQRKAAQATLQRQEGYVHITGDSYAENGDLKQRRYPAGEDHRRKRNTTPTSVPDYPLPPSMIEAKEAESVVNPAPLTILTDQDDPSRSKRRWTDLENLASAFGDMLDHTLETARIRIRRTPPGSSDRTR